MGLTLIRAQNGSQRIGAGGSHSGAPVPDDDGMEARSAIRVTLVSLCRLILDERGIGRPADDVPAMAAYIGRHATWLAAHPAADEHAKDLRDIAGDRRNWSLAYPSGSDRLYIGDCPLLVADLDGSNEGLCGTRLYAYGDQPLIQCQGCGTEETVEWWQREIVGEATRLVDAYAGAADLAMRWSRPVDPALIRKWAQLGKVARHGQDGKRRTLYDVDELRRYAEQVWACVAA
ncbi:hypothetical protein AB0J20_16360 [Micromonospora costi]|uniref:hypothetical protein n=1 Tax=Micromonospora costi TaxID=1530042 RepID=UPI0033C19FF2